MTTTQETLSTALVDQQSLKLPNYTRMMKFLLGWYRGVGIDGQGMKLSS